MTAYSDFPPSEECANYMHNSQMLEYLRSYADYFKLKKYIKFGYQVLSIERSIDYSVTGEWEVTYRNIE